MHRRALIYLALSIVVGLVCGTAWYFANLRNGVLPTRSRRLATTVSAGSTRNGGNSKMWFPFSKRANKASSRLHDYISSGRQYRILIGVPVEKPSRWLDIVRTDGTELVAEDGQKYDLSSVRSFVVAYPNGEILDSERMFALPKNGVHFIEQEKIAKKHQITLSELERGNHIVQVTHVASKSQTANQPSYATVIRNISDKKIKVECFGGYTRSSGNTYDLHTITKNLFTSEEFVNWYNQHGEWLLPGESASDPQNYGGPGLLWVYFCVTEDGDKFAAGSLSP